MRNAILLLGLVLLISSATYGQSDVELGNVNITIAPGIPQPPFFLPEPDTNMAFVPLSVSGSINDVKTFSFQFRYDPDVVSLKFDYDPSKERPGISGILNSSLNNISIAAQDGIILMSWVKDRDDTSAVNLSGELFKLDFYYGDTTDFSEVKFDYGIIQNMSGVKVDVNLINGSIAPNTDEAIKLLSPEGGELWEVIGPPQNIEWTSVYIDKVRIEFSSDNGAQWDTLVTDLDASLDSYFWTIPNITSTECLIKVSEDIVTPVAKDSNDVHFTINSVAAATVLSPNDNERLKVDGIIQIKWEVENISDVRLEYTIDASAGTPTWFEITDSTPAIPGIFQWEIPNAVSADCKIKISDVSNPAVFDESDNLFQITADPIQFTIPDVVDLNLDEIRINIPGILPDVHHWFDNHWELYDPDGSYPDATKDTLIVNALVPINIDWLTSISGFDIQIRFDENILELDSVLTPFSEELRNYSFSAKDGLLRIVWHSNIPINVYVKLFDIRFKYAQLNQPSDWLTNPLLPPGDPTTPEVPIDRRNFSLLEIVSAEISDSRGTAIDDLTITDGSLAVSSSPSLKILTPVGGDIWEVNDGNQSVDWESLLTTNIEILFSSDDGDNYSQITPSVSASAGSYSMSIPDLNSTECKIKIIDLADGLNIDESDLFTITNLKSIDLLSPDGGEVIRAGETQEILWESENIDSISIELSLDSGSTWRDIDTSFSAALGTFTWNVPDTNSALCKIRITDTADTNNTDESSDTFTITDQPKSVSLPDTAANAGNISIPIQSDWFFSATRIELNISFNPSVLVFDDVTSSLLSQSGFFISSAYEGIISITWLGDAPLDIHGNIIFIDFNYVGGLSDLIFTKAQIFDEENKLFDFVAVNGSVEPPPAAVIIPDLVSESDINFVPITVSEFNSATSLEMQISYDEESLVFNTLNTDKPELLPFTFQIDTGVIHINWETVSEPVNLEGQLFNINFSYSLISPEETEFSELKFIKVEILNQLNQELPVNIDNGSLAQTEEPAVKLFYPNGGEIWEANGEPRKIEFSSVNTDLLTIKFSQDNGSTWILVEDSVSVESGIYDWIPPDIVSSECKISVNKSGDESIFDVSLTNFSIAAVTDVEAEIIPINYFMEQNYPNPFNPSTIIRFGLPGDSHVVLTVYNVIGEKISTLINEYKRAGIYEISWNANNFGNGVYLYRIQSKDFNQTKKMILLK